MAKTSNLQLRAVLLTLLLAGCEGARVEQEIHMHEMEYDAAADENKIEHGQVSHNAAAVDLFQFRSFKPVCKDMSDATATVQRYEEKRAKLIALSEEVLQKNCMATCPLKIRGIKNNLADFQSCNTALAEQGSMPAQLRDLMEGSTDGLQAMVTEVSTNLMALLKKNGMFKKIGNCEFNPQGFNVKNDADDMDKVRKDIFGENCGSEDSVNTYIQSSSKREQKTLNSFMEKVKKMVETRQHAKETGESVANEIHELTEDMSDVDASLLEVAYEGGVDVEDAEGTMAVVAIVLIVLFIVCMLLVWWTAENMI